jgi:hypothetical protein
MQTEPRELERRTENLERRVDRIEGVLPTLATKKDLKATEQRLRTEITITAVEQRLRTHFDVVGEGLRHEVQIVAEAVATLAERGR